MIPDATARIRLHDGLEPSVLVGWHATMVLIREFERVSEGRAAAGKIPGGMHSAAGQEAVAVGSISAMGEDDVVTSSHRSHHHAIAMGLTPRSIMAELYGKVDGCLRGRGGHMHLADFSIGLYGSNGIVGGGLGLAMGVALAMKLRRLDRASLAFFGDGGASLGRIWESINLAALWSLPLVVVCENNLYAVETPLAKAMAGESIARRAAEFGLPSIEADGQDVAEIYSVVRAARERAIAGEGPSFIEARTYRYDGHNTGDPQNYRTRDEVDHWRATKDPIDRVEHELLARGHCSETLFEEHRHDAAEVVADAVAFAEASPWPDSSTAADGVLA